MSDPIDILGWLRFDERLTSSGLPSEKQLAAIAALGSKYVINLGLHTHERALSNQTASVEALGMAYVHIPVDFNAPQESDFDQFCKIMRDHGDEPIHVHCIVNARVSAFLYRYRRDVLGVSEQIARDAMEKIWTPGGVWAEFIGDHSSIDQPYRYHLKAG